MSAFLLRGPHFFMDGRHVLALAAAKDRHRRSPPQGGARGIDRGVAAADHRDSTAERHPPPLRLAQKVPFLSRGKSGASAPAQLRGLDLLDDDVRTIINQHVEDGF